MGQKIQVRRGLSSVRTTKVLDSGEPGFDTDTGRLFIGDGTTLGGIPVSPSMAGYIDGLVLQWNSASSLTVTSGSSYVPGVGRIISLSSPITLSGLSLPASAFSHVYLDGSSLAIVISSTAPGAPYNGTARTMNGDNGKRYLGSVLTDASGNIYNFSATQITISYVLDSGMAPFRVLSSATNTAYTSFSFANVVPPTATLVTFSANNTGNAPFRIRPPGFIGTGRVYGLIAGAQITGPLSMDSSLQGSYMVDSGGIGTLDVLGYQFGR